LQAAAPLLTRHSDYGCCIRKRDDEAVKRGSFERSAQFARKNLNLCRCVLAASRQFPKLGCEILPPGLELIDRALAQNLTMLCFD
jgi:hypothetical protein